MNKLKIGIASFSHPMVYGTDSAREAFVLNEYRKMSGLIGKAGFEVLDSLGSLKKNRPRSGIATNGQAEQAALWLKQNRAECLVINLNQWTNPHMCVLLMKLAEIPCALYVSGGVNYPGETTAAAIWASAVESSKALRCCVMLERFREGEFNELLKWMTGSAAVERLKKSRLLAWGGSYGANIPYTRDDEAFMEDLMIREVIFESEEYLTGGAKKLLAEHPERISAMKTWLSGNGVSVDYDAKMLTKDSFDMQLAQYLAARDRLDHYKDENIAAVSVKCHFDVSTECLGCTECMIPAFLPFFADAEGKKQIMPTVCEGDIKGAMTSAILGIVNPGVPPLFGDVIAAADQYVMIANCGSSSVYWAARNNSVKDVLSKVRIMPQLHGSSGGSVRYLSAPGQVTAARLFRFRGQYCMYFGLGQIEMTDYCESTHGLHWPQTLVNFGIDHREIFKTIPCQHMVLTEGDFTGELEYYCRYLGIITVRCDDAESLKAFRRHIAFGE